MTVLWLLVLRGTGSSNVLLEFGSDSLGGGVARLSCPRDETDAESCREWQRSAHWLVRGSTWTLQGAQNEGVLDVIWENSIEAHVLVSGRDWTVTLSAAHPERLVPPPESPVQWAGWSWNAASMTREGRLEPGFWFSGFVDCVPAAAGRYFVPLSDLERVTELPVQVLPGGPIAPGASLSRVVRPCPNLAGAMGAIVDKGRFYRELRDSK